MRAVEIGLAVMALRTAPPRPQRRQLTLAPLTDDADGALLNRAAIDQERTALVASLWPAPGRQCVIPVRYALLDAPASFGELWLTSRVRQERARRPQAMLAEAA